MRSPFLPQIPRQCRSSGPDYVLVCCHATRMTLARKMFSVESRLEQISISLLYSILFYLKSIIGREARERNGQKLLTYFRIFITDECSLICRFLLLPEFPQSRKEAWGQCQLHCTKSSLSCLLVWALFVVRLATFGVCVTMTIKYFRNLSKPFLRNCCCFISRFKRLKCHHVTNRPRPRTNPTLK